MVMRFTQFHRLKYSNEESSTLSEGGAFGHLSHPFDIEEFTFADLKSIIEKSLSGELEWSREKTDGVNLLVSWKDGRLIAARNRGHLKNFGEKALDKSGVASMFSGRGTVQTAFVEAMNDLEQAIEKLSEKNKEKIFKNGKKFMSIEVLYSDNPNVIQYGFDEIRFHGTLEYDETGTPQSQLNKQDGITLAEMLKKIRANKQRTFDIKAIEKIRLKRLPDYDNLRKKFVAELVKIMKEYKMTWSSTIKDYVEAYWLNYIESLEKKYKVNLDKETRQVLLNRWAHSIKTPNIKQILKMLPNDRIAKAVADFDKKQYKNEYKKMQLKFEILFLRVGVEVLKGLDTMMAVNPDKTLEKMKKDFHSAVEKIGNSKNPDAISKLRHELERINKIGGIEHLVPAEGITFFYKGELLKLTGLFAPINQITNLLWKL